ncbi:unnamed protein product [Trichogramma brassicae]|uniref:Integrator complex subunit 14 n=1 Tax=Trichogramma brassicae TaxID=86971 RepID=A0A6H5IJ50_9HYME|nr:unnamed protein product [Trichogramma brassicae]
MPTVIALDVSLSMRRVVVGTTAYEGIPGEQLTRHHLALQGINTILHYLQNNSKLEFVALPQTKKTDFEVVPSLMISKNIEICGFIPIADVGNPGATSRHLILPMPTEKNSSMQGIAVLDEDDEIEEVIDEGKEPSFCVLLHGALKVENMAALCLLNADWYGFIYSWADSKKKSNLMLTVLEHGCEVVPWLGNLRNLGSISFAKDKTFEALTFPIRPVEKRSYSANTPSWIRNSGLQSDIQKILRQARKLPEKTANFYKELNRVRRTALTLGFLELLEGLAQIFDREITLLPPNVNPECAIQLSHCSEMLRKPYSKELNANISPLRTKYSGAAE